MDETEVGDVEEVFDHPRPFGAKEIWARPESSGTQGYDHKQTGEDRPQVLPSRPTPCHSVRAPGMSERVPWPEAVGLVEKG